MAHNDCRVPRPCTWLFLLWLLCGAYEARAADDLIVRSRPMLHTVVEVKAWGDNASLAIEEAFYEMERVNGLLNNYDADSDISRINRYAGGKAVGIAVETAEALKLACELGARSSGALDITVGPLLTLWGFDRDPVGLAGAEPDAKRIRRTLALVDYRAIKLFFRHDGSTVVSARLDKKGMRIDVGAFSKGYVADRALKKLKARGITNALIAAGGTICVMGTKPDGSSWKIGVRHPQYENKLLTAIPLSEGSVSTSGDYERFYIKDGKRRTHIIDPRTGVPVEKMQAVSVIAPSGAYSDALSTALFVLGPEEGTAFVNLLPGIEALLITRDGHIVMSSGWPEKNIAY